MKKVIYYFTGTGNSLRASIKIAQRLQDTTLISMRNDPTQVPATDYEMIGFVYPVYHWSMPEPVVRFVENLDINSKAYIFVGAMPSFILGNSCERLEQILALRGGLLSYSAKVNSVANYVLVYPPMPAPKYVIPRTEKKLERIAQDIANRQKNKILKENILIRKFHSKIMDPYKELEPYADVPFTISIDCIGCGLCSKICPVENIVLVEGKPTFRHQCVQCMACVSFCPPKAIGYEIKKIDLKAKELKKIPVVKKMGLPAHRHPYHNPYIQASDLMKNQIIVKRDEEKDI